MSKKFFIILLILIFVCTCIIIITLKRKPETTENNLNDNIGNSIVQSNNETEENDMNEIILKVNGKDLYITLENNSSAEAFANKLKEGNIVVSADDYGNFEKVGNLGFNLPTNDENITTEAGDLILYQGNKITLYYDKNTWNFTKLGHVQNISKDELKEILGEGKVEMTFSLVEK